MSLREALAPWQSHPCHVNMVEIATLHFIPLAMTFYIIFISLAMTTYDYSVKKQTTPK